MDATNLPVVRGFRFGAVAAGIKKRGGPDVGAIVADRSVPTAALFTRNIVKAAPVVLAQQRVRRGSARAVLVNAGCANACTGAAGLRAARETSAMLARALGANVGDVLPASTGVIGMLLPTEPFARTMNSLVGDLSSEGAARFAEAIRTTDRWPKASAERARIAGADVIVLGIAKGAGMIHPDMATTLAFVVTDARIGAPGLRRVLRDAASDTFNALSVDGDTSTNDTLIAMASGAAESARAIRTPRELGALTRAFRDVLAALARSIAADGEGAEHQVTIEVTGARSVADARRVARTIATSPLVKTALFGKDPNWGRILGAAGRAGVIFDPAVVSIRVDDVAIVRRGEAIGGDAEARAHEVMTRAAYSIGVSIGRGSGRAHYFTCDLGHAYVDVNASYRS